MFILSIVPLPLPGNTGDTNPSQRLAEIRGQIAIAEQRVRDLESKLTDLILNPGSPTTPIVSGVDNTDANLIRQALYAARADEGELRTAEQFWNNIVDENKKAQEKTADLFKKG